MPGARSVVNRQVPTTPVKVFANKSKRAGSVTDAEQALITQFVLDQPREVTTAQVTALSRVLRRTKEAVKDMVVRAREDFQESADFYVKSHKQAVERALGVRDKEGEYNPKALDVAAQASQWALENLSAEGQRIVDKPSGGKGDMGPRILVGINIGGLNAKPAAEVIEITSSEGGESTPLKP